MKKILHLTRTDGLFEDFELNGCFGLCREFVEDHFQKVDTEGGIKLTISTLKLKGSVPVFIKRYGQDDSTVWGGSKTECYHFIYAALQEELQPFIKKDMVPVKIWVNVVDVRKGKTNHPKV